MADFLLVDGSLLAADSLLATGLSLVAAGLIAARDFFDFPAVEITSSAEASIPDLLFADRLVVGATGLAESSVSGLAFRLSEGCVVGLRAVLLNVLSALGAAALGLATALESVFLLGELLAEGFLASKFFGSDAFFDVDLLLTLEACFSLLTDFSLLPRFLPSAFLSLPTDFSPTNFALAAPGFALDNFTIAATNSSFFIVPALATPSCLAVEASSCLVLEFKSAAVDKIGTPAEMSNEKGGSPPWNAGFKIKLDPPVGARIASQLGLRDGKSQQPIGLSWLTHRLQQYV